MFLAPSPGQYTMYSDFDIGVKAKGLAASKGHQYTFGQSFTKYKKVFNPDNPQPVGNEAYPGPGSYNDRTRMVGTAQGNRFGIQGRTKNTNGKSDSLRLIEL